MKIQREESVSAKAITTKRHGFHGFHQFHLIQIRGIREIRGVFIFGTATDFVEVWKWVN
jgi:hypothetical protein